MTTTALPRRILSPLSTALARRPVMVGFLAAFVAGLVLLAATSVVIGVAAGASVLNGVRVGGVEVGGLDRAAAAARLSAELPSLSAGRLVVTVEGVDYAVAYADLGRGYELEAMLDSAVGVGRSGNPIGDAINRLRSLVRPTELPVVVHASDPEPLAAAAAEIASQVRRAPADAAVLRNGADLTIRRAADGRDIDPAIVAAAISTAVSGPDPADVALELEPEVVVPIVDTTLAYRAAATAERIATDLRLSLAGAEPAEALLIDGDEIMSWISFGPQAADPYAARFDRAALASRVAAIAEEVDRAPVGARIAVAGAGLGGVIAALDGRTVEVAAAVETLAATLDDRARGGRAATIALPVSVTEPALTTAEAQSALPQMRLVSSWTTYFTPNDGNGFGDNIIIGARDIDGRTLAPGESFSFWGGIGPVTVERGYHYGGVIIGGRSVAGGAIGGGICSTSTTLFNAALRAGLEMGERDNHYYYIDRYPDGLDATVFMSDSYVQDMTFRNDTDSPVVIRGFGGNGSVTFQMWMVPTGRSVVITEPATSNVRAAIETTQLDPSMAPGSTRRVEFPHDGHDVSRTRYVYGPDGTLLHEDRYFSSYGVVNGITMVGPALPPPDDEDPPTDP